MWSAAALWVSECSCTRAAAFSKPIRIPPFVGLFPRDVGSTNDSSGGSTDWLVARREKVGLRDSVGIEAERRVTPARPVGRTKEDDFEEVGTPAKRIVSQMNYQKVWIK